MDLPERRLRELFHAKLTKEKIPVFWHPGVRFTLCESQVQTCRRTAARSTTAGGEGMDEPAITGEERVLNPG